MLRERTANCRACQAANGPDHGNDRVEAGTVAQRHQIRENDERQAGDASSANAHDSTSGDQDGEVRSERANYATGGKDSEGCENNQSSPKHVAQGGPQQHDGGARDQVRGSRPKGLDACSANVSCDIL